MIYQTFSLQGVPQLSCQHLSLLQMVKKYDSSVSCSKTSKTKEMVVDFGKNRSKPVPVSIRGTEMELVPSLRYLGVQLDNKMDWKQHIDMLYKKGQSHLYFLRRLRYFNICKPLLCTIYQSVVASALLFSVVSWREGACTAEKKHLNRL